MVLTLKSGGCEVDPSGPEIEARRWGWERYGNGQNAPPGSNPLLESGATSRTLTLPVNEKGGALGALQSEEALAPVTLVL